MEIKDTKAFVEYLLREYPALRGNDDVLYLEVLRKVHPYWNNGRITTNIENMPIGEFLSVRKNMKLPSFESVRRSRSKIMEEHPELRPAERVQESRKRQEEKFYKFATKQADFCF